MSIQKLSSRLVFPDPSLATKEGLLAYGGDLSPQRLELAYRSGIFPWYDEDYPEILWWSPDPRMLLFPNQFKTSRSLRQKLRRGAFEIRLDTSFSTVIDHCSRVPREGQGGTWITSDMKSAYVRLHQLGLAHSVEAWRNGELVGGLYGLSFGNAFFGESMFHLETDASKVAFHALCQLAQHLKLAFIDCQMTTDHLLSLGAEEHSRDDFLALLALSNKSETHQGSWSSFAVL